MVLSDFLSRHKTDDSNPYEIIPISFSMRRVLHEDYYKLENTFKYEGMLSHSFDRFYVEVKYQLPKVEDLRFTTVDFDSKCRYLASNDRCHKKIIKYCLKPVPYIEFYKRQIK